MGILAKLFNARKSEELKPYLMRDKKKKNKFNISKSHVKSFLCTIFFPRFLSRVEIFVVL